MRTRLPAALAAAALSLTLAACGGGEETSTVADSDPVVETSPEALDDLEPSPTPAVTTGEFGAVPAVGATLGLEPDETGNVPLASFPNACELLTTQDVQTILPSVTAVETDGIPRTYIGLGTKGGTTPFPAECDYVLTTPNNPNAGVVDWKIIVDMSTLADPAYVKQQYESRKASALRAYESSKTTEYPTHFAEYGTTMGGEEAYYDDTFGIVVRSGVALLYVDARLPGYLGEETDGTVIRAAKIAAREKVAGAVAQALAPRFAG